MKADPKGVLTGSHFVDGDHACCEGARDQDRHSLDVFRAVHQSPDRGHDDDDDYHPEQRCVDHSGVRGCVRVAVRSAGRRRPLTEPDGEQRQQDRP